MADKIEIAHVIRRAIKPLKQWADNRLEGTRAEKLIWEQINETVALEIVDALLDAGFAIIPLGGHVPTDVTVRDHEQEYRKSFRATMEMPALAVFMEHLVSEPMASDDDFVGRHLPRIMARELLRSFEDKVAEQLFTGFAEHRSNRKTPVKINPFTDEGG